MCIAVVGVVQLAVGLDHSVASAGIVKPAIWQGEIWRLLTGTLLHANMLHFLFNAMALLGLGKLVEVLTHRAYTTTVFVLTALVGSICSLLWLPAKPSVGASGGILGLLGFLIVFGYTRRYLLPPGFLRGLLRSVAYIVAIGLLAYNVIDNAAHLGGLLSGLVLGMALIRKQSRSIPLRVSRLTGFLGILAGIALLLVTLVCLKAMLFGS